ncbi:MAG: hypothetical protein JWP12_3505 [Bacteroidetes bacterium]|nr:hypothetical protein [Bacteroidota bacterium]
MKNVLIICLTLLLKSTFGQNPPSLLKYKNKDFTLSYPANWDTVCKDNRMTFMAVEKKKNDKDIFRENFCIYSIGINEHVYLQTLIEKVSTEFIKQGNPEANILKQAVTRNKKEISYGIF